MFSARFLSFSTGFLSLGLEILWVRLFSFANHSLPQAFVFVLIFFLIGIAIGAYIGKLFCESTLNLWKTSGCILLISSLADFTSPWLYASLSSSVHQLLIGASAITFTALLKAIIFPIAHHLGTPKSPHHQGRSISMVYASNVLGSTLGPLCIGIILLAFFTTQQSFFICASLTFVLSMYCCKHEINPFLWCSCTTIGILLSLCTFAINKSQLLISIVGNYALPINRIVENQYGIIITYKDKMGDIVTGGNVYDGRTNLDPIINSNGISRLIILSALQEHPRKILMIGLSIGTWLKLVTAFPNIEKIDVIEINPGYLTAIADYPAQQSGLKDPRTHLYIDDGRRWLKNHPTNTYDLIIMNTSYYWRAYITHVLSQNFLRLLHQHMNTNAIIAYNSTGSPDAFKTAASVFKYTYLYHHFIIAADFDWRYKLIDPNAMRKIASLKLDGKTLFPPGSDDIINFYLRAKIKPLKWIEDIYYLPDRKLEIITDNNPITEYKYGIPL